MREHLPFGAEDVAVVARELLPEPRQRPELARPVAQPGGVHAVAGAKHGAAGNPLVRLDDIEAGARGQRLHCLGKAAVARGAAAKQPRIGRIAGDLLETGLRRAVPVAG